MKVKWILLCIFWLTAGSYPAAAQPRPPAALTGLSEWAEDPFWNFMQRAVVIYKRGIRPVDMDYFLSRLGDPIPLHVPLDLKDALRESDSPVLELQKSVLFLKNTALEWSLKTKVNLDNPKLNLDVKLRF